MSTSKKYLSVSCKSVLECPIFAYKADTIVIFQLLVSVGNTAPKNNNLRRDCLYSQKEPRQIADFSAVNEIILTFFRNGECNTFTVCEI